MEIDSTSQPVNDSSAAPTTFEEYVRDPSRTEPVMNGVYTRGDRLMSWLVALHVGIAIAFAGIYSTWLLSMIVAALGAGMFFLSVRILPRHRLTRIIAGVSLQTFVALHIYQLHGLPEMHFFFFTAFTAMVVYEDGASMWPGTVLIIAQHILFALMQNMGVNLYFFEDPYIGIRKLCFHFGIAILHVALCGVWAHFLRNQALLEAFQRERLVAAQDAREVEMTARFEVERARTRAEDAARAKGEFLATMSHEMRTPLNGILGMSDLMSRSQLTPKQTEQLETLHTCADNLLALVNDVLDLSKIEAGGLEIEKRSFDLAAMVDDVLALNSARAQSKGIELFAVVNRAVPRSIESDETRIRQTLTNLVSNAVKFTSEGEVELKVETTGDALRFSVRDTGIGIDETTRARLFSPFTQADSSIGRRFGGSGLGLAISKRLVEAMGGAIAFESAPGKGSLFRFDLPLVASPAEAATSALSGRAAIVVSPHEGTRSAITETLAARGALVSVGGAIGAARSADVFIVDDAASPDLVKSSGAGAAGTKVVVLCRGGASAPASASGGVSWPLRIAALEAAVSRALDPASIEPTPAPRGLAWRPDAGRRVLVVEDNPVNQVVAQSMLEELGVHVELADDGERALEILKASSFDLVLMDCQMPVLDGFETTRRIRAGEAGGKRVAIVALTAQAMSGDADRCRAAGMDDYLPKPIERRALLSKLERFLQQPVAAHRASAERTAPSDSAASADKVALVGFLTSFGEQAGGGALERLSQAFLKSIPTQTELLRSSAVRRGDKGALKDEKAFARAAHSLRGAVRSVGMTALGDRLAELEQAASEPDRVTAMLPEISARLAEACAVLRSHRAGQAAGASVAG